MASIWKQVDFHFAKCQKEVKELGKLLRSREDLSEKDDILPFFKTRDQLCAFLGTFAPDIGPAPLIAREFSFLGDFAADVLVGNRSSREYLAVEFEDGRKNSIFRKARGRGTKDWSPRFEHGYSQLIDWFATLDDYKKTDKYQKEYGRGHITFSGLLIVGRSSGLTENDRQRLDWRADKVLVDSHVISCITFDDLHETVKRRLEMYAAAAPKAKK